MNRLNCVETYVNKENAHCGSFIIEPLEIGQGITIGNSLRRTLLSDLTGYAISGVRINNLKHEFSLIEGIREDVLEVILNLKEINFKTNFTKKYLENLKFKGFLNVKGPLIVTAGLLNLPKDIIKIINPSQYICTILDKSELYIEIDIENGKGYKLAEENNKHQIEVKTFLKNSTTFQIDAIYMPIKKVNYKVKLIHDIYGNIKESLIIEVVTNGSLTAKRSLNEALKILIETFYSLFINQPFINILSKM